MRGGGMTPPPSIAQEPICGRRMNNPRSMLLAATIFFCEKYTLCARRHPSPRTCTLEVLT